MTDRDAQFFMFMFAIAIAVATWAFVTIVRYIARREVNRAIKQLRHAKFKLVKTDPRTGRFVK